MTLGVHLVRATSTKIKNRMIVVDPRWRGEPMRKCWSKKVTLAHLCKAKEALKACKRWPYFWTKFGPHVHHVREREGVSTCPHEEKKRERESCRVFSFRGAPLCWLEPWKVWAKPPFPPCACPRLGPSCHVCLPCASSLIGLRAMCLMSPCHVLPMAMPIHR